MIVFTILGFILACGAMFVAGYATAAMRFLTPMHDLVVALRPFGDDPALEPTLDIIEGLVTPSNVLERVVMSNAE